MSNIASSSEEDAAGADAATDTGAREEHGFTAQDVTTVVSTVPPEGAGYWETARGVARRSIDAAMWISPVAATSARLGTQAAFSMAQTTMAATSTAASVGLSTTNALVQAGLSFASMDPARRASLEALATSVHIASHMLKGAIGVSSSAAAVSMTMAQTIVLTGVHLTAFATQLGLSYGRSRLDHADAAVDKAMGESGVLPSVLGNETAEVVAGLVRLMASESLPLRTFDTNLLAKSLIAYACVQYVASARRREDGRDTGPSIDAQTAHLLRHYAMLVIASYGDSPDAVTATPSDDALGAAAAQDDLASLLEKRLAQEKIEILVSVPDQGDTGAYTLPAHYLAVAAEDKSVVLVMRGSLSYQESIRELYCHSEAVAFSMDDSGAELDQVHAGMMEAARQLSAALLATVEQALRSRPGYRLDLVGFGYGAGVCALLGMMWRPIFDQDGTPVHVYALGSPCVVSPTLSEALRPFVTSVVLRDDMMCRLSYGSIQDLMTAVGALCQQPETADKVIRLAGRGFSAAERDWMCSVHTILLSDMHAGKLVPPGVVYYIHEVMADAETAVEAECAAMGPQDSSGPRDHDLSAAAAPAALGRDAPSHASAEMNGLAESDHSAGLGNDAEADSAQAKLLDADVDSADSDYVMVSINAGRKTTVIEEAPACDFVEIYFSPDMLSSHSPWSYEEAIRHLCGDGDTT